MTLNTHILSQSNGQHGSGSFFPSSSVAVASPSASVPTPSSNVRLLLGPAINNNNGRYRGLKQYWHTTKEWIYTHRGTYTLQKKEVCTQLIALEKR